MTIFYYYEYIRSVLIDGYYGYAMREHFWAIGTAILWIPFALSAHLATLLLQTTNSEIIADGTGGLYYQMIGLSSLMYSVIAMYVNIKLVKKFYSEKSAYWAVLFYGLGILFFFLLLHMPLR